MWCHKFATDVKVEHCEQCITRRECYQWCLDHFVWAVPDGREPLFDAKRHKSFSKKPVNEFWLSV